MNIIKLKAWIDELDADLQPTALLSTWNCIEAHEDILAKDVE